MAGSCGDQTGDQPQSGNLVHTHSHTKDSPLASPESQKDRTNYNHLSDCSGSDHSSGAAFLTIARHVKSVVQIPGLTSNTVTCVISE